MQAEDDHPSPAAARLRNPFRWLGFVVLVATVWLARVSLPHDPVTLDLDPSYQQALGVALEERLAFGRDVVFTSGPLAYFRMSPYVAGLYDAKLWLWEVALGLLVAFAAVERLLRRGTALDVALGALVLAVLPRGTDEWLFLVALLSADLALGALHDDEPGSRARAARGARLVVAGLLAVVLVGIKVTSIALVGALGALVLAHAWAVVGARQALAGAAAWLCLLVLGWLAIGQRALDLPAYVWTSLELAAGFDAAMSLPPALSSTLWAGLFLIAVLLAACVHHARSARATETRARDAPTPAPQATVWMRVAAGEPAARAAAVTIALLLAFKAGFTRADHAGTFFSAACFLPQFLLAERPPRESRAARRAALGRALLGATAIVALFLARTELPRDPRAVAGAFADHLRHAAAWLLSPEETRHRLEDARRELAAANALPRTRDLVGERGAGTFTVGDGILFLNDIPWRPRPVFQAFSVFTPRAARANAEFLASERAPPFHLLRASTIDRRLPCSEDPLAVQVLLRDYAPRAHEGGFLLVERDPPSAAPARAVAREFDVAWGDRLALPEGDDPLVLRAGVRRSLLGSLRALAYQSAAVEIEVEFADGGHANYRVAPFALELGVVLRPWLPHTAAWVQRALGRESERVVALRFTATNAGCFAPRIAGEFEAATDLERPPADAELARELVLGAAGEPPSRYVSPREPDLVGWEGAPTMLLAHAPATLAFARDAGRWRLVARIDAPPWLASEHAFPGVRVRVVLACAGEERELLDQTIGARAVPGARDGIFVDQELVLPAAGEVRLVLEPLAGGDPELASVGIRRLRCSR